MQFKTRLSILGVGVVVLVGVAGAARYATIRGLHGPLTYLYCAADQTGFAPTRDGIYLISHDTAWHVTNSTAHKCRYL